MSESWCFWGVGVFGCFAGFGDCLSFLVFVNCFWILFLVFLLCWFFLFFCCFGVFVFPESIVRGLTIEVVVASYNNIV